MLRTEKQRKTNINDTRNENLIWEFIIDGNDGNNDNVNGNNYNGDDDDDDDNDDDDSGDSDDNDDDDSGDSDDNDDADDNDVDDDYGDYGDDGAGYGNGVRGDINCRVPADTTAVVVTGRKAFSDNSS
ncbi:hypothetical protein LOAG_10830 [Loa loa]|uniref:Uncharacterized protein n=1 Tax=Loa loa TaxID=7209 RepID=A0A1S0TQM7_LOALO|nr:hypothetical protein LOAG_10830 [Loa loa]EFO17668.1 hypothetical protein LOAG_10830 [Loa loa]